MRKLFIACSCVFLFPSYSFATTDNLEYKAQLKQIKQIEEIEEAQVSGLRFKVLEEAAYSYGFQQGAAYRQQEINTELKSRELELEKYFDFTPYLIEEKVLPPVIIQADNGVRLEERNTMSTIAKTYQIIKEPRFITAPVSWREYLLTEYTVGKLNKEILPKNSSEEKVFEAQVDLGFLAGVQQAEKEFDIRLNELTRDLLGVILFHQLAKQNIVSMPQVSVGNFGITVQGKELSIDEKIFRVSDSVFQGVDTWKP